MWHPLHPFNDESGDQVRMRVWHFLAIKSCVLIFAGGAIAYYGQSGMASEAVPIWAALAAEFAFIVCHALWVKARPQQVLIANYLSFLLSIIVITLCLAFLHEWRTLVTAMYFGLVVLVAFTMPQRHVILQVAGGASVAYLVLNFFEALSWAPFSSALPRRSIEFLNGDTLIVIGALCVFAGLIIYWLSLSERTERQRELAYRLCDDLVHSAEEQTLRLHKIGQRLLALQQSTRAMSGTLALEDLLQRVARECLQTLQVEVALVLAVDGHPPQLAARALAAQHPDKVPAAEKMLGASWQTLSADLLYEQGMSLEIFQSQQPLFLSDFTALRQHPIGQKTELALQHYFGMRSLSLVPLATDTQTLGLIALVHATPPPIADDDKQIILTFAQHAAIAIHNARLFTRLGQAAQENVQLVENLQNRTAELSALQRIAAETMAQSDWQEVLRYVTEQALALLKGHNASIYLLDETTHDLGIAHSINTPPPLKALRFKLGEDVSGVITQTGLPLIVEDYRTWAGRSAQLAPTTHSGAVTMLGVPLLWRSKVIGALLVADEQPKRRFNENDKQLLTLFAQTAANTLGQVRLLQATQRHAHELTALYDLSLTINTQHTHVDALLQKVAERTVSLVGAQMSFIELLTPQGDEWVVTAVYQMPAELVGLRVPLSFGLAGRVAATGQPLAINDYPHWSERSDKLNDLNIQSVIAVPLLWEGKTFGVLHVADTQPQRNFTVSEIELLQLFAAQAAVAIQNTQLTDSTLRRLDELSLLHEASLAANAADPANPQIMLNRITDALLRLKPHWRVAIILKGWGPFPSLVHGGTYPLHTPVAEIEARLTRGVGIIGWVFAHGEAQNVPDVRQDTRYYAYTESTLSELCVPLKVGAYMLGVIDIDADQLNAFSEDDVRLVTTLAAQIAASIDTARRHTELTELYENTRDLALQRDMPTLLQTIVTRASALLGGIITGLHLYDAATQDLTLVFTQNTLAPTGSHIKLGEGLVGKVAQTRQPLIVDDYRTWADRAPLFTPTERVTALAVPLLYSGDLIGVLIVSETGTSRRFTDAEQRLLSLFASQAASAVHNARLLAETTQRANELAALYDNTRDLATSQDLPTLLETIVERACTLLNTASANMRLYQPSTNTLDLAIQKNSITTLRPQISMNEGLAGLVAQTRQPMIKNDYNAWDERLRTLDKPTAVLGVPMLYSGDLIGVLLVVAVKQTRQFTEADSRLLSLFASQAAGVVHGARLYDRAKRQLNELVLLYDAALTHISATPPNLAVSLQSLVSALHQFTHNGNASIIVWDEHQQLILRARAGDNAEPAELALSTLAAEGRGIVGWVATHGEPLNVPDVRQDARYIAGNPRILSELCVPIHINHQVRGLINIESPQLSAFDADDVKTVTTLAAQLSGVMENVRLYDELQTQVSQLKKAQVQLERSARLAGIGQLAAGIAHEINNPLAAILGFSELLQQTVDDALQGDVAIILKEAQRVRDIVHGLLDFARQREPHKELADLNQLLEDTLKLYRYQLNKARVQTHTTCDPALPPVEVDPNQIKQVLLNLFANATQAMPQGGDLYLTTQSHTPAEIILSVRDTGTGIAPAHLPRIFEPFFTTKEVGQGTGLGLAISFGIMQNHHGRIEVESAEGQGCCFKLYLPVAPLLLNDSDLPASPV